MTEKRHFSSLGGEDPVTLGPGVPYDYYPVERSSVKVVWWESHVEVVGVQSLLGCRLDPPSSYSGKPTTSGPVKSEP